MSPYDCCKTLAANTTQPHPSETQAQPHFAGQPSSPVYRPKHKIASNEPNQLNLHNSSLPNDPTTYNATRPSTIWSMAANSMWPIQLFNGDPIQSQAASLIQWSILIGFLIAIILLIMLIVRKLFISMFPSYQWMLAKQAIKSTSCNSTQLASTDCSCHHSHAHRAHLAYQLSPSSVLGGPKSDGFSGSANITPHHMCYSWHEQQPIQQHSPMATCQLAQHTSGLGGALHQCLVDTNGSAQIFSPGSPPFNTDLIDGLDRVAGYPTSISNPSVNNMNLSRHLATSVRLSSQTSDDPHKKHKSPNVPASKKRIKKQHNEARETSASVSSGSESVGGSSRSSIQSTTAQMLSNEASSSFDHSDHIMENLTAPNTPSSASQSQKFTGLQQRRQSSTQALKLASPLTKTIAAQSQSSSPMLATDFANRFSGKPKPVNDNNRDNYYEEIYQTP